ncbi:MULTISPECIES: hypothetical protein [Pseudomonas]|uniref:EamA domain-containing protein n=1 Tax=Pseudomonas azadiae TaxID=2843612 RepID=A0ABS6P3S5_9PSED|nr:MULTISPECIES: hypothetical protein [Pseudomonas]MBV4455123.1 hypothetical protein [Pseudomonas azadiae]NMF44001.1 hypothetical protein [Pseudomonas sp. SWRI 103]
MKDDMESRKLRARWDKAFREWTIIILSAASAVTAWSALIILGKLGPLVSFNFLSVSLSALLIPVSLIAKELWLVRSIAIVGMIIVMATAFVNPPWVVSTQ